MQKLPLKTASPQPLLIGFFRGLQQASSMEHDAPTNTMSSPAKMEGHPERKAEEEAMTSLEEMTKYRAAAQQNSIDAIRAAEERSSKAKDGAAATLKGTKEAVAQGVGAAASYAAAKGAEAKDAAAHGARVAAGYTAEKGAVAKDVVVGKGEQGYQAAKEKTVGAGSAAADYAQQAAGRAKEATVSTGKSAAGYTAEKGAAAKDVVVEKGQEGYQAAKEKAVGAGSAAADYAQQAAGRAKEATVSTGKSAAEHAKDLAEKAKEVTVSTGKSTAEYVREKAVETKDATAGVAQKAAEYTSQRAAEAKASARAAVQAVAQKADAAKDAAAQKGHADYKAGETTEETTGDVEQRQLNFDKDKTTGDGAGRRAAEKDKTLEAPPPEREIHGAEEEDASKTEQRLRELSVGGEKEPGSVEAVHGDSGESYSAARVQEGEPRSDLAGEEKETSSSPSSSSDVGGLFEAVGEAVIGIAQTAKEMLLGRER